MQNKVTNLNEGVCPPTTRRKYSQSRFPVRISGEDSSHHRCRLGNSEVECDGDSFKGDTQKMPSLCVLENSCLHFRFQSSVSGSWIFPLKRAIDCFVAIAFASLHNVSTNRPVDSFQNWQSQPGRSGSARRENLTYLDAIRPDQGDTALVAVSES